jgi:hypothetical protein
MPSTWLAGSDRPLSGGLAAGSVTAEGFSVSAMGFFKKSNRAINDFPITA